jgi:hypothetical protein
VVNDNGPNELIGNSVVAVYDSIASAYDVACVFKFEFRIEFQNSIHGFTNNFNVTLYSPARAAIIFVFCKNFRLPFEIGFYLVDGLQHISQACFDVIIHIQVFSVDRETL